MLLLILFWFSFSVRPVTSAPVEDLHTQASASRGYMRWVRM
jgi:hypothetical protein